MKQAFTLIELLVVVLIVGILAAIALPQYNLAVAKSRVGGLFATARSIAEAEEVYYMENGTYTRNWDEIAVDVAGTKHPTDKSIMSLDNGDIALTGSGLQVVYRGQVSGAQILFFYRHASHAYAGKRSCYAKMNNDFANKVCQMLTNRKTPNSNNGPDTDNIYHFQ